MIRALQTSAVAAALLSLAACETIGPGIAGIAALNAVCVTGYQATIKPRSGGAFTGTADFRAAFTNPNPQPAQGSIALTMLVRAKNISLGTPPQNIDVASPFGFATPVTAVYPAQVPNGYHSPVVLGAPHDSGAIYDIEIRTNIPGTTYDGTPCHTFIAHDVRLPPS
ncbi:MAG: hypothetical protein ABIP91_06340 [Sphingomicrobium sp.]